MKRSLPNRPKRHSCALVGAWALSAIAPATGTLSCSNPQRFQSAMTDQPAVGDGPDPTEPGATGEAGGGPRSDAQPPTAEVDAAPPGSSGGESGTTNPLQPPTTGTETGEQSSHSQPVPAVSEQSQPPDPATSEDVGSNIAAGTSEPNEGSGASTTPHRSSAPALETTSGETSDGAALDECPDHEPQLVAGSCGCGHEPDPQCDVLREALSHRYSFVGHSAIEGYDATKIPDSVGTAHGSIHGAEFDWDGSLLMDGQDSYVDLPPGLLSGYDAVTIDLWVKWWGGEENQRLLNFGLAPNDSGDAPDNYLSISPSGSDGVLTVQYRTTGDERGDRLEASGSLGTSNLQHITVVIREQSLSLFVAGTDKATTSTVHRLSELDDNDNWLGRALYSGYPPYTGAFFEFRVFNRALTDGEIKVLDRVGLDWP